MMKSETLKFSLQKLFEEPSPSFQNQSLGQLISLVMQASLYARDLLKLCCKSIIHPSLKLSLVSRAPFIHVIFPRAAILCDFMFLKFYSYFSWFSCLYVTTMKIDIDTTNIFHFYFLFFESIIRSSHNTEGWEE